MVILCLSFVQKKVTMLYSSPTDKVEKFDFWNFSALVTRSSICSSFDEDWHCCLNKEPLRTETAMSISNKTQNGLSFRFWICYWKLLLMLGSILLSVKLCSMITYFSWENKALVKGGRDCGHCLSLATSHKCGWCSTIEVCTTLSQCKSNPFNSTTHQVSIHDYFLLFIMEEVYYT